MKRLPKREQARIKAGDEIEVSGERWVEVLRVPFGFPYTWKCLDVAGGWPVHWDHITAVRPKGER